MSEKPTRKGARFRVQGRFPPEVVNRNGSFQERGKKADMGHSSWVPKEVKRMNAGNGATRLKHNTKNANQS